jgi:hypothetical protein
LPLLQYLEFPWRILSPVAICLAMLVSGLGPVLDRWPQWRNLAFATAMALLIVPNLSHLAPRTLRDVDPSFWTPQKIAARGLEVTTAGEYVPRWVQTPAPYSPRVASVLEGDADVRQTERTPESWSAQVTARRPSSLQIGIAYFPGWRVRIDGNTTPAIPAVGTGQLRFDVPQGDHRVAVMWERTTPVWLGDGLSLLAFALLVLLWRDDNSRAGEEQRLEYATAASRSTP